MRTYLKCILQRALFCVFTLLAGFWMHVASAAHQQSLDSIDSTAYAFPQPSLLHGDHTAPPLAFEEC